MKTVFASAGVEFTDGAAPDTALDDFIQGNIAAPGLRAERGRRLKAGALPFSWPHMEVVETSI